MAQSTETPRAESGAFPEDSAAGGTSVVTVPQAPPIGRRATAADREAPDPVELWATARMAYFAGDFPQYAGPEWHELSADDPRRFAAALEAAEKWRKYGDEQALVDWFREAHRARSSIADRRDRAELDAAARPHPPRALVPTPGWPPIAVPGQPGKLLTYRREKAA